MSTIDLITQKTGVAFRPASAPAIEALLALGVPEEMVAFYRQSEPSKCIEIGKVRTALTSILYLLEDQLAALLQWRARRVQSHLPNQA